jgi:hypothetical protein
MRGRLLVAALVVLAVVMLGDASAFTQPRSREAVVGRIFRGNGGKTLPPFSVSQPSTLFWTNNGGIFQIFPSGASGNGSVNSQAAKGWTYLPAGRYALQINAIGDWVIDIELGVVRPRRLRGGSVGYRGNGGLQLPPFHAPRNEQLYWQATGDIFQIFSSGFSGVEVNSQAHKGSTYMRRGTQTLQINAIGSWVIYWRP